MNMIKRFSLLAALVAVMFAFNACEEDSTGPSEEEIPNAPVNLKALAADASTVHLKWSAPGDLDDTMFDSYTVTYYPEGTGSTDAPTMDATEADMPFPVTGLDSNLVYTFDVVTNYTNGETSTVASINWAPAMRFEMITAETIKLYEVSSSLGSGLQLFNADKGTPEPLSVDFIEDWNIALYATDDMLMFGTPTELPFQDAASAVNSAEISNFSDNVGGLNDVFESIDLENRTFSARSENLAMTSLDGEAGLVMYVRAPNGDTYNYAKVFIKGNGSGGFLQGTGDNEYVEVMISYQANAGFPYAKK